ncbi:VOC family protein [Hylemonella gracilis]|uniref:VOC family protein n=1 Tax=Hylemonella gracilis TaxID=80880 RepID=A0A4P6UKY7_9BURK|nr:VOC family protein [Hylemonella gracilis]QBK04805.1 VOC family protein [Hylemonella gracilis]
MASLPSTSGSRVDHLVIAAHTLDQGVAWCRTVLGVEPGPGGEHLLMGTHNRLLALMNGTHPVAYLEIIAINPRAPAPGHRRWYDLDEPSLQAALRDAPRLIHFVAQCADAAQGCQALSAQGIDRGALRDASRQTAQGLLEWKITVREDGQRLYHGALPTLIQWGETHPSASLPDRGLRLRALQATHPQARALQAACQALGLDDFAVSEGSPNLIAMLQTPRGTVRLESLGA